jgi:hypothetical protein
MLPGSKPLSTARSPSVDVGVQAAALDGVREFEFASWIDGTGSSAARGQPGIFGVFPCFPPDLRAVSF